MTIPGSPGPFPSQSEITQIGAITDAATRNRQITEAYWKLSAEVERRVGGHVNWCTFATWASQQAGVTIRHEDLTQVLRERLRQSWRIRGFEAKLIELLEAGGLDLLQVVVDSVSTLGPLKRSSDAVGDGNRKVFEEIGLQFARWLALFSDISSITDAEMEDFCTSLAAGPPPDGQDLLRQAFANYRAAAVAIDAKQKAELMLLANLRIGYHEQIRLQPDIQAALDGAMIEPGDLANLLMQVLGPRQGISARAVNAVWPFEESPLEKITKVLAEDVHLQVRMLITENLMSLWLPPADAVQLGRDLTRPFPADLLTFTSPDLTGLLASFDPALDTERGSGVKDWANFRDRMRFIADLFRAYGEDQALFEAPAVAGAAAGA